MSQSVLRSVSWRSSTDRRARTLAAVRTYLANAAAPGLCEVFYWRERNREVNFILRRHRPVVAIEVKSGRTHDTLPDLRVFAEAFKPTRKLLIGGDGIAVGTFLSQPVISWFET